MHIHRYEKYWITFGVAMLVAFLVTIFVEAFADSVTPPQGLQAIDPTRVAQTPPFDHPGLRRSPDGTYEAYYVARVFSFTPSSLTVPVNTKIVFYVTSADVVHGMYIAKTDVNMMAEPGWVNSQEHIFYKKGTYLLICHEYCGIGHQNMFGRIEVR
jgi:cytochrome c oxidase subunit II